MLWGIRRGLERRQELVGGLGLAGAVLACAAWLFDEGRDLTFYLDEWYFPLYRLKAFTVTSVLAAHNGHIAAVPTLIYEALLSTSGMREYTAYRSLVLVAHLIVGVLVYLFATRRIGPVAALAPTAVILFFGPGAENYLFAFQIDFVGPVVTGLACLLLIDRQSLLARVAITVLLIVTVAFSEVGIAFLVAAAVALAAKRRWRDGWMVAIPAVLYALWYSRYGWGQSGFDLANVIHAPRFVGEEIAGAAGTALGLDPGWGILIALALGGLVFSRIVRHAASATMISLLAGAGAFWLMVALTRSTGGSPYASRYLYIGCVFILLIGVELLIGGLRLTPIRLLALALATVTIVVSNFDAFFPLRNFFDLQAEYTRVDLGALEIARQNLPQAYVFSDPSHGLPFIQASDYFAAVGRYGSAAYTPAELAAAPAAVRAVADQVLTRLEPLVVKEHVVLPPSGCHSATSGQTTETAVTGSGVVVSPTSQPVLISGRRFADSASVTVGRLNPGQNYLVTARQDASTLPWKLLTTSGAAYSLCTPSA